MARRDPSLQSWCLGPACQASGYSTSGCLAPAIFYVCRCVCSSGAPAGELEAVKLRSLQALGCRLWGERLLWCSRSDECLADQPSPCRLS